MSAQWPPIPENRLLRSGYLLLRRYLTHRVGMQSAALAFYLLFMLFPFMIFVSALLGLLQLDTEGILRAMGEFLPRQVVEFAEMYLTYVGENPNPKLMVFGLVFSVWFPMRFTNTLMRAVRTAYHLGPPERAVSHGIKVLGYTLLLMAVIVLTLLLMTVGDRLLMFAVAHFRLPAVVAKLWFWLRFPVAAAAGAFALFFLYALAQDRRQPLRNLWPGTLAALGAWLALSWMYAFYVDNIANYSLLYGSIGTVIVLLIWLWLSAVILIMGAEWNGMLMGLRKERRDR